MPPCLRLNVPDTRLPFVNAEIAQVMCQGHPYLVSSIWGGNANGRLYFWNPDSGHHYMRRLPSPLPGAYMLRTGEDQWLYIGCGNGDLWRYHASDDLFEQLVEGHMRNITWGGAISGPFVFWNAFHETCNGSVAVYDVRERRVVKTWAPLDSHSPPGLYGHRAITAPDGNIIWHFDTPSARVIIINPDTMEREVIDRPWLSKATHSSSVFMNPQRLALLTSQGVMIVSYPDFSIENVIDLPPECASNGHNYPVSLNGNAYFMGIEAHHLWEIDAHSFQAKRVITDSPPGGLGILAVWQNRDVCSVTPNGMALRFKLATGAVEKLDLEATGPLPAHAFCADPQRDIIIGAPFINQRFWRIDHQGEGRDLGRAAPGGGQINHILLDPQTQQFMMSSYTSATVTAYDPDKPASWPHNPRSLASASAQEQMRPKVLEHDGRFLWMATTPKYGMRGGALSRVDPINGECIVWRNLVPDQSIHNLALDPSRRRLFLSTSIHADCESAEPTAKTAVLATFDMDRLEITATYQASPAADNLHLLGVLSDGTALFCKEQWLVAWSPDNDTLETWGIAPQALRRLLSTPDGQWIALTSDSIGVMEPKGEKGLYTYTPRIKEGATLGQIADGKLYYATAHEIVALPLATILESDQD